MSTEAGRVGRQPTLTYPQFVTHTLQKYIHYNYERRYKNLVCVVQIAVYMYIVCILGSKTMLRMA